MTTLMATRSLQADKEIELARQSLTDANAFAELYCTYHPANQNPYRHPFDGGNFLTV